MLKLLARLIGIFVVLMVMVRVVGATTKDPLAAMFTETTLPNGQHQVCWRGICPGKTSFQEAANILNAANAEYYPDEGRHLCWKSLPPVYSVCLRTDDEVTLNSVYFGFNGMLDRDYDHRDAHVRFQLGDAVALWGTPVAKSWNNCEESAFYFEANVQAWAYWLINPDNVNLDYVATIRLEPRLSDIFIVILTAPPVNPDDFIAPEPWRGFITDVDDGCAAD